jgi:hypothetical protein
MMMTKQETQTMEFFFKCVYMHYNTLKKFNNRLIFINNNEFLE